MKKLLEETITTLNHAKVFISSKQKMHEAGQELYQETIDKLTKEYEHLCDIDRYKQMIEDEQEKQRQDKYDEEKKC